jgi:hypothetical protein
MSRKLIFSILVLSFAFLDLLAVRQKQINTVHEMALLHQTINDYNDTISALSIAIESACSPTQLQQLHASTLDFDEIK